MSTNRQHNIVVNLCVKANSKEEAIGHAKNQLLPKLMEWYNSDANFMMIGDGYPPGSLLFYSWVQPVQEPISPVMETTHE